jgi:hypothetical protein
MNIKPSDHEDGFFWVVAPCSQKFTDVSEMLVSIIRAKALMMEAASTSETSANFYLTTGRNNPEDSHLNTHRRENPKSQQDQ